MIKPVLAESVIHAQIGYLKVRFWIRSEMEEATTKKVIDFWKQNREATPMLTVNELLTAVNRRFSTEDGISAVEAVSPGGLGRVLYYEWP